jgi:hypothetical protein
MLCDAPGCEKEAANTETVVKIFEGDRNRWIIALNEALKFVRDRHEKKMKKMQKEEVRVQQFDMWIFP